MSNERHCRGGLVVFFPALQLTAISLRQLSRLSICHWEEWSENWKQPVQFNALLPQNLH